MSTIRIYLLSNIAALRRDLLTAAGSADIPVEHLPDGIIPEKAPANSIIVLDLERSEDIDRITKLKARLPGCYLAASIAVPDQERWMAALAAGADLVCNQGALPGELQRKFSALKQGRPAGKLREKLLVKQVVNTGDGLVGRVADAPDGVICVFRSGEQLFAFRDSCPHAGFSLSDGPFDPSRCVLTCPAHGSQFDISSGERVRGPADFPIKTYPVLRDGSMLYVEV